MATTGQPYVELKDLRGGRNGSDPPMSVEETQCVEAINVDWYYGTFARKRPGSINVALTSSGLTGIVSSLVRHTPTADETAAELWAFDSAAKIGRYSAGAWAGVTAVAGSEGPTASYQTITGCSLNGKLFLSYKSGADRLHCFDGTNLRRTGLAQPAAPALAETGAAGTYAGARSFKVAYTVQVAGVTTRRSELSSVAAITPAGTHTGVIVSRPALLTEGETHWEIYGSTDGLLYNLLTGGTNTVATASWTDTQASYNGSTPDEVGTNTVLPSGKYLLADANRLLIAGSWETAAYNSRVWWTAVIGSNNIGDDERFYNTTTIKGYLDLDAYDGGGIVGIAGPINGSVYVFKGSQIYKLVRTGNLTTPYIPVTISKHVGAIRHQSIVLGEDEAGAACIYFLGRRGPYRVGPRGLEFLGYDIQDLYNTVNLAAANVTAHGIYHPLLKQVWWWVATGSGDDPGLKLVFDVSQGMPKDGNGVRYGWSQHTGLSANARCSVMFANTLGATVSTDLRPYIGKTTSTRVLKCDAAGATDDDGTAYQAYVDTRPTAYNGLGRNFELMSLSLVGQAVNGVSVQVTVNRDFSAESRNVTADLTPIGTETRKQIRFESAAMQKVGVLQFRVGDAAAVANTWNLDALVLRVKLLEDR